MWTAVITALAALAGVALGRLLDVRVESAKWLREHRAIAYGAYIGASERYLAGVLIAGGAQDFRGSEPGKELDRIYGDVQVFGSDSTYPLARDVRENLLHIHTLQPKDVSGPGK